MEKVVGILMAIFGIAFAFRFIVNFLMVYSFRIGFAFVLMLFIYHIYDFLKEEKKFELEMIRRKQRAGRQNDFKEDSFRNKKGDDTNGGGDRGDYKSSQANNGSRNSKDESAKKPEGKKSAGSSSSKESSKNDPPKSESSESSQDRNVKKSINDSSLLEICEIIIKNKSSFWQIYNSFIEGGKGGTGKADFIKRVKMRIHPDRNKDSSVDEAKILEASKVFNSLTEKE